MPLTIVLVNNAGGAVFDYLPIAAAHDVYEEHVATPPGVDFRHAAALYGLAYEAPATLAALRAALAAAAGATLIEVRTDRARGVEVHRRVASAVAAALTPPGPAAAPPA